MTDLRKALDDYLTVRRSLGYRLAVAERLLGQFLDFLEGSDASAITTALAIRWASLPSGASPGWLAQRLSTVRLFASFVAGLDGQTEIPPVDCLPGRPARATPYLYRDDEIEAIMAAARRLRTPLLVHTYEALIGLLSVSGMRIGEAIGLRRNDVLLDEACVQVIEGKFDKSRELPLAPSSVEALRHFARVRDELCPRPRVDAFFCSRRGRGSPTRGCSRPFGTCVTKLASWRPLRAAGRGCMTSATGLRSRPSSRGRKPVPTSTRSCRCSRRSWGT